LFLVAAGLTLVFRFWLAAVVPITGDEAYFIEWGRYPDWGFYDHPPMIGWWLAALLSISDAEWWLRLPQVFQPVLLALAVRWVWPYLWPDQRDYRDWVALLVLLAPMNVWNVFVTTDTALVYCAVLSGLAWLRATQDDSPRWYLVAGVFLAGAVLSKYFAALLGFAYLIDALNRRSSRAFAGLAIAYACCLPALGLMAWWNSGHCWTNYLFNFVNRHGKGNTGFNLTTPLLYPAMLFYIFTPPAVWALLRRPLPGTERTLDRSVTVLMAVPLLLFALLSLIKTVGLHWVLAFVPFALMLAARRLTPRGVQKLVVFFLGFALLHVALALTLLRLPLETWRSLAYYPGIVLTFESRELVERASVGETLLASDGYSNAVTLGYHAGRHVPVLGPGSGHARHDDILTDWRVHDGRDITVLRKTAPRDAEYVEWFRSVSIDSFEQRGARFWVVRGQGFDYARYRDTVLAEARRRYYAVPHWLPLSGCYFCDRYFPENTCRR
jgi:4-amino-4-deoxy-L-arabinose transferase-like glycosyltransferase